MLTKEEKQTILERKYTASFYVPWADSVLFQRIVESLAEFFEDANIEKVLGLEARGFILGAPVAYLLHAGFVVGHDPERWRHKRWSTHLLVSCLLKDLWTGVCQRGVEPYRSIKAL